MIKTTTYSDLLKYAYNESSLIESDRTQRAIDGDPQVKNEFDELHEVLNMLDAKCPQVPDHCIEKVLNFARG